jgi:hypothetical protein
MGSSPIIPIEKVHVDIKVLLILRRWNSGFFDSFKTALLIINRVFEYMIQNIDFIWLLCCKKKRRCNFKKLSDITCCSSCFFVKIVFSILEFLVLEFFGKYEKTDVW